MYRNLFVAVALLASSSAFAQTSTLSCSTLEGNLRIMADKCLAVTTQPQRSACFEAIGKGVAPAYQTQCTSTMDKLKTEYTAKEKAKFPTQVGSMNNNNGGGNSTMPAMPTNTTGGTSSTTKSPTSPTAPTVNCATLEGNLHMMGDKCIAMPVQKTRNSCFEDIGKGIADAYKQQCSSTLEKVKMEYTTKEKSKYPTHGSSFGNDGGQMNMNTPPTSTATSTGSKTATTSPTAKSVDCTKLMSDTTAAANKCLAVTAQLSRKKCFDAVGETVFKNAAHDACQGPLDSLKGSVQSQEHARYPTQPSALD